MTDGAAVFAALADPTRRAIVEWLGPGVSYTATELAGRLPMTRQAVTKHLAELEDAGLVMATRVGREVRYAGDPAPLDDAAAWLDRRARRWDERLARLRDRALESGT